MALNFRKSHLSFNCVPLLLSKLLGKTSKLVEKTPQSLGKCHFLPGGGPPENWGGSGTLSKIKRGDQKIFQIKKGGSLIFFKEIKYFVKHSWNSC